MADYVRRYWYFYISYFFTFPKTPLNRQTFIEVKKFFIIPVSILIKGENKMSKGQNTKKGSKKVPLKTLKEKKAAKRDKKNEKNNSVSLDKKFN